MERIVLCYFTYKSYKEDFELLLDEECESCIRYVKDPQLQFIDASDDAIISHATSDILFIIIIDDITFEGDTVKIILKDYEEVNVNKFRCRSEFLTGLIAEYLNGNLDMYIEDSDIQSCQALEGDVDGWVPIKDRL